MLSNAVQPDITGGVPVNEGTSAGPLLVVVPATSVD